MAKKKETKTETKTDVKSSKTENKSPEITPEMQFKLAADAASKNFSDAFQAFVNESDKMEHQFYDTGSVSLNTALGGYGVPQGRIVEVWGPTGGGKTSLALEIAWNIQNLTKKGVVFVDIEHKLDRRLFDTWKGGFDPNLTYYIEPWNGEMALDVIHSFVQSPGVGAIILDSVSGLLPAAYMEGDSNQMAQQASLIRNKLPTITSLASRAGVTILAVNQVRAKIEAMQGGQQPRGRFRLKKTGGYALDHWICVSMYMDKNASKTYDAKQKGLLTDGQKDLGHWAKIYIEKNHAGPTLLKSIDLCLMYGYGFDMFADIVERAISVGIISKSGGWYSLEDLKVQGASNFNVALAERPDLKDKIVKEMKDMQLASVSEQELGTIEEGEPIGETEGVELDSSEITPEMVKSNV